MFRRISDVFSLIVFCKFAVQVSCIWLSTSKDRQLPYHHFSFFLNYADQQCFIENQQVSDPKTYVQKKILLGLFSGRSQVILTSTKHKFFHKPPNTNLFLCVQFSLFSPLHSPSSPFSLRSICLGSVRQIITLIPVQLLASF